VYKEFRGWNKNLSQIRREEELPYEFMTYVRYIEDAVGVPVSIISLGPDRDQTIIRD
jgi:adenylosuccinate synthase